MNYEKEVAFTVAIKGFTEVRVYGKNNDGTCAFIGNVNMVDPRFDAIEIVVGGHSASIIQGEVYQGPQRSRLVRVTGKAV